VILGAVVDWWRGRIMRSKWSVWLVKKQAGEGKEPMSENVIIFMN